MLSVNSLQKPKNIYKQIKIYIKIEKKINFINTTKKYIITFFEKKKTNLLLAMRSQCQPIDTDAIRSSA
jgi:hypothetical protein